MENNNEEDILYVYFIKNGKKYSKAFMLPIIDGDSIIETIKISYEQSC